MSKFGNNLKRVFGLTEDLDQEDQDGSFLERIEENRANELLKSECSEYERQQQIFHLIPKEEIEGMAEDFYVYDPLRKNKPYDKNYHIMIVDQWDNFPRRRNGLVAYANKDKITEDGLTYAAIPFNRTLLGIAPKETLDESFNNVSINLGMKFEYFNRSFNIVLNIFNNPVGTYEADTKKIVLGQEIFYDESFGQLKEAVKNADAIMASEEGRAIITAILDNPFNKETEANVVSILEYVQAKGSTLSEIISNLFSPEKNVFNSMAFKDFIVGEHKDQQLWFNNKCLLVRESLYDSLEIQSHDFEEKEEDGERPPQPEEEPVEEPSEEEAIEKEEEEDV